MNLRLPKRIGLFFWILCSLLNQEYTALFCETLPNHENELMRGFANQDYRFK